MSTFIVHRNLRANAFFKDTASVKKDCNRSYSFRALRKAEHEDGKKLRVLFKDTTASKGVYGGLFKDAKSVHEDMRFRTL
jgi:hypothetical protein